MAMDNTVGTDSMVLTANAVGRDNTMITNIKPRTMATIILTSMTVLCTTRIAAKIQFSRRRENLTFTHHQEVCRIDEPDVQDRFLL
jgi:hypothetical protein